MTNEKMTNEKTKAIIFRLDEKTKRAFDIALAKNQITAQYALETMVKNYLKYFVMNPEAAKPFKKF